MQFSSLVNGGVVKLLPYRMSKPIELLAQEIGAKNLLRLNLGESPYGVSRKVSKVMADYVDKVPFYPDSSAYTFKHTLKTRKGYAINHIVAGADSHELVSLIARAFLNDEVSVIVPSVNSAVLERAVNISGAKLVSSAIDDNWCPNIEAILQSVDDSTRMIMLANPSNPLGAFLVYADIEFLLSQLPKNVLVVVDESLIDYLGHGYKDLYSLINDYQNLILLRSFSYAFGLAGLRVGYMLSCDEISSIINVLRDPYNVSQLALDCASESLTDKVFINYVVERTNTERNRYKDFCAYYGLPILDAKTSSVTIDFGEHVLSVYNALLSQGIFTRPLNYMGLPSLINITLGHPKENDFVLRRIEKILLNIQYREHEAQEAFAAQQARAHEQALAEKMAQSNSKEPS